MPSVALRGSSVAGSSARPQKVLCHRRAGLRNRCLALHATGMIEMIGTIVVVVAAVAPIVVHVPVDLVPGLAPRVRRVPRGNARRVRIGQIGPIDLRHALSVPNGRNGPPNAPWNVRWIAISPRAQRGVVHPGQARAALVSPRGRLSLLRRSRLDPHHVRLIPRALLGGLTDRIPLNLRAPKAKVRARAGQVLAKRSAAAQAPVLVLSPRRILRLVRLAARKDLLVAHGLKAVNPSLRT
jgi:hypothetical protein